MKLTKPQKQLLEKFKRQQHEHGSATLRPGDNPRTVAVLAKLGLVKVCGDVVDVNEGARNDL